MITLHVETWRSFYDSPEREDLWNEHYEELCFAHDYRMPMSPDVAAFQTLCDRNQLLVICAREAGVLLGYSVTVIRRHLHYDALCAFEDSYFVTKSARSRGVGLIALGAALISKTVRECKKRGVVRAYFMTKQELSIEKIFDRLGMEKMDSVHVLWVQDGP